MFFYPVWGYFQIFPNIQAQQYFASLSFRPCDKVGVLPGGQHILTLNLEKFQAPCDPDCRPKGDGWIILVEGE